MAVPGKSVSDDGDFDSVGHYCSHRLTTRSSMAVVHTPIDIVEPLPAPTSRPSTPAGESAPYSYGTRRFGRSVPTRGSVPLTFEENYRLGGRTHLVDVARLDVLGRDAGDAAAVVPDDPHLPVALAGDDVLRALACEPPHGGFRRETALSRRRETASVTVSPCGRLSQ